MYDAPPQPKVPSGEEIQELSAVRSAIIAMDSTLGESPRYCSEMRIRDVAGRRLDWHGPISHRSNK